MGGALLPQVREGCGWGSSTTSEGGCGWALLPQVREGCGWGSSTTSEGGMWVWLFYHK